VSDGRSERREGSEGGGGGGGGKEGVGGSVVLGDCLVMGEWVSGWVAREATIRRNAKHCVYVCVPFWHPPMWPHVCGFVECETLLRQTCTLARQQQAPSGFHRPAGSHKARV